MIVPRFPAVILLAAVASAVVGRAGEAGDEPRVVETVHEPPAVAVEGVLPYRTTYRLWLPAGDGPLRALVVHQHGCGKGASDGSRTGIDDLQWQALARAWRCGLLVPTYETADGDDCRAWCDPRRGSDAAFLAALERLADAAGCPEVATIPRLPVGTFRRRVLGHDHARAPSRAHRGRVAPLGESVSCPRARGDSTARLPRGGLRRADRVQSRPPGTG